MNTNPLDDNNEKTVENSFIEKPEGMQFETTHPKVEVTAATDLNQYLPKEEFNSNMAEQGAEANQRPLHSDGWGSAEHIAIGNEAFKLFIKNVVGAEAGVLLKKLQDAELFDPDTRKLTLSAQIKLTPGEIVALFGDFYGDVEHPIAFGQTDNEKIKFFEMAYATLENADPKEIEKLLAQISKETDTITKAIADGKKPHVILEAREGADTKQYSAITRYSFFPGSSFYSRYLYLLKVNFDHFYEEAREAYRIAHYLAMQIASNAGNKVEKAYLGSLIKAFVYELCGCHFFTDLFAGGHVRAPRKDIYDYTLKHTTVPTKKGKEAIAGLLAHEMHNEDGRQGVNVTSKKQLEKCLEYLARKAAANLSAKSGKEEEANKHEPVTAEKLESIKEQIWEINKIIMQAQFNTEVKSGQQDCINLTFGSQEESEQLSKKLAELNVNTERFVVDPEDVTVFIVQIDMNDFNAISGVCWKAYGDSCYYEPENSENKDRVLEAMQAALSNVYNAFIGNQEAVKNNMADYLPTPLPYNHSPLFRVTEIKNESGKTEKRVEVRRDVHNIYCTEYVTNWLPFEVFLKLKSTRKVNNTEEEVLSPAEQASLQADINNLQNQIEGSIECKLM